MQLSIIKGFIFKIVKFLYNISEADNYWFKIYYIYYFNKLGISQSIYNLCLLYRNKSFEIIGLQTDNTLFVKDAEFADKKQNNLKKAQFLAKDWNQLTFDKLIKFNKDLIYIDTDSIIFIQEC